MIEWLEHVVDGSGAKRVHGVAVAGRHEDHRRALWDAAEEVHAEPPGHRDVEEHDVRGSPPQKPLRFGDALRTADHVDRFERLEHLGEAVDRLGLVVDEQGRDHPAISEGSGAAGVAEVRAYSSVRGIWITTRTQPSWSDVVTVASGPP